jgi:phenylacetaldehyde dehydrogenase
MNDMGLSGGAEIPHIAGRLLIDGEWSTPAGPGTIDVFNPADGRIIGTQVAGGGPEIDAAVRSARRAFEERTWTRLAPSERAKILWRVSELIDEEREAIALLETLNNGMPLTTARWTVASAAETFRYFAGWCTKVHGLTSEISNPQQLYHAFTLREPIGVCGLIVPWNIPFNAACSKVATALAAGCVGVLKPAEETPLSAFKLGEILLSAGVPPGVINIVTGLGEAAGAALANHPDVDKISFTGSTEVGKKLVVAAAGNLKKLSLELGGKSPVLVMADADLTLASAGAARGIFINSGQACMAGSRIYVHSSVHDDFVERLAVHARALRLGDGFDPATDLGPLISQRQLDRVCRLVKSGVVDQAQIVTGGAALDRPGYFMPPTVMTGPRPGAEILREEIFGPVVTVMRFDDVDEAVVAANDTEYGLAAAIWTNDIKLGHRTARRIKAGSVWLNCQLATDRSLPFGGYKQSGWGRESGAEGVDAYLQTKSVVAAL